MHPFKTTRRLRVPWPYSSIGNPVIRTHSQQELFMCSLSGALRGAQYSVERSFLAWKPLPGRALIGCSSMEYGLSFGFSWSHGCLSICDNWQEQIRCKPRRPETPTIYKWQKNRKLSKRLRKDPRRFYMLSHALFAVCNLNVGGTGPIVGMIFRLFFAQKRRVGKWLRVENHVVVGTPCTLWIQ